MKPIDLYAVMYKRRNNTEWSYANENVILTKSEILLNDYKPDFYLNQTTSQANKIYVHIIGRYKGDLEFIKISRMNKYSDNKSETEVVQFREFD